MNMVSLKVIGRAFFGTGISGIGFIHFVVPGFRPDILPIPPEATWQIFPYLMGAVMTVVGIAIVADKGTKVVSLSLGLLFILFLLLGHLPLHLTNHPGILVFTIKLLALAGGLLVLSNASDGSILPETLDKLYKITRYGKYMFALQLIVFGIAHLVYAQGVQNMIPEWIPARLFWVYATGIALMGSGVSIFIAFKVHLTSLLLALMLFTWLVILHLPSILKNPFGDGSLLVSSIQCLACCGIALLICYQAQASIEAKRLKTKMNYH
jgi:uncharacterized membrane protein YphA (DoxX/SURF4 family)